eukprot:scaffold7723_cov100-Isochrysis_galbana.AAC.5
MFRTLCTLRRTQRRKSEKGAPSGLRLRVRVQQGRPHLQAAAGGTALPSHGAPVLLTRSLVITRLSYHMVPAQGLSHPRFFISILSLGMAKDRPITDTDV